MKLRNKKTGEVIILIDHTFDNYNTLAEVMDDWEDAPAEPLIKNESVRKAVRAWAEAIGKEDNLIVCKNMEYHDCCIYDGELGNTATIDFGSDLDIEENSYTLAELCGEEE